MPSNHSQIKNIIIITTELAAVFLMVFNILPRELSLAITGIMIFYFIFSPIEDSLWVFIASIPLFIALPITENFDSMANWRILIIVLFFKVLFRSNINKFLANNSKNIKLRKIIQKYQLETLAIIFILLNCFSLLGAEYIWVGLKKIFFLVNIISLFIIIKFAVENEKIFQKIIKAAKTAVFITIIIGLAQYVAVFFTPLANFWQFWSRQIIPVFYGQNLGDLLANSNSWFSYYAYLPPTLRMFSIFPDSHSFAFFVILSLPFILTAVFLRQRGNKYKLIFYYLFLIVNLLVIIFSGSRGAWVSALGAMIIFIITALIFCFSKTNTFVEIKQNFDNWRKFLSLIIGAIIIFFLLFPISSGLLFYSQRSEAGREVSADKLSIFERAKSITDFSEISAKSRLQIWQKTSQSIIKHPFLGVGIGNFPVVIDENISSVKKGASAHNLYLDIASETGVFAFLIFLLMFYKIFKKISDTLKQEKKFIWLKTWAGFFSLALIWILGYSLFDVVLLNDRVFLFFTVCIGLLFSPANILINTNYTKKD